MNKLKEPICISEYPDGAFGTNMVLSSKSNPNGSSFWFSPSEEDDFCFSPSEEDDLCFSPSEEDDFCFSSVELDTFSFVICPSA